ncbi:MAG: Hsp70 family protein, partial [Deltaproteobacteria bacterium]|nr:Hsp70 family protein [Deltaproteobacteria bacterium]
RLDSLLAGAQFNQAARQVKIALSTSLEAPYTLEFPEEGLVFSDVFTVEVFNRLAAPLVGATLDSCRKALAAAGKAPENMDEVVLVGGSTRIPLVRHRVEMFFNKKPHVALNPDEVVALGAAVQGHLLAGGRRDYVLLDVVPLALGLETLGGTFTKLITANTTIPAQAAEMFTTSADNQTAVELNIYQGEREFVKDCRNLGRFKLRGIPPMAAGLPRVNVTFLVDANGILTVSALEERSGKEAAIEVVPSHGLTNDEVERMMEESFQHATEDLTRRQMVEFSQMAEAVFAGIRKVWPQAQRIMSEPHQQAVHKQMDAVRESMGGSDPLALKAELDKLGGLTRPLADAIISQAATMELKRFLTDHGQE